MVPLRIALLTYSTRPRGSVVHTLELAAALHRLGHQPTIFALAKGGETGFERPVVVPVAAVPAQTAPDPSAPDFIDALIRQRIQEFVNYPPLRAGGFDIYHAQDCIGANALGQLRQQGVALRLVRTVHHIEDFTSPYLQDCQDKSIRLPDCLVCVSQLWQDALRDRYGIVAHRVFNGVDCQRFTPTSNDTEADVAQRLRLGGGPRLLTVGGLEPRKNSLGLLRAFAYLRRTHPQAQLVIAGGATLFDYQPYRQACFELMAELGLEVGEAVVLPGVVSEADLPALYRLADSFVFPSLQEGWGLVVLEAMASGVPVVTANQPPFTEFLAPHQALLVDPHSPEAMAAAMVDSLRPEVRRALVAAGLACCQGYDWQVSAERHVRLYQQLIDPGC